MMRKSTLQKAPLEKKEGQGPVFLPMSILLLTCVLCACAPKAPAKRERPLIGFSMDSFVVERWTRDRDIFMATAAMIGADVILQVGEQSAELQERQVQSLIDRRIDVLVIVPNDADRLTRLAREARRKGIRVICYDRLIRNAGADLYISFDNVKVGNLQAQALTRFVPSGDIVILHGAKNDLNAIMADKGYFQILDTLVASGRYRIVFQDWPDDWRSEWAMESMRTSLDAFPNIKGVIAANDMMAEAAIKALAERRLAGKVPVMGHDAELSACQRIYQGTQAMTVYKPLKILASKAAEFAVALAKNEKIETDDSIDDGSRLVPFYKIEPIPVYKENIIDTVIKDGFHATEDIFPQNL